MKTQLARVLMKLVVIALPLMMLGLSASAEASIAYGTLNNFDCVNDVVVGGNPVECHGFEIELEDIHSTDISYTYDYNHYGVPNIREDNSDPAHPRVYIRWAAKKNLDGSWTAYTAIPSGPISPTDGHQFTNPSVNFGGEHFGVGYNRAPTAVRNFWLMDDGANLIRGPLVNIAMPTFNYYPAVAQVQPVIVPPPPPAPPVFRFGDPSWVKDIKTTTHNANKVELTDLVDPDPDNPNADDWTNGEPAEVETEWRLLQTEFAQPDNPDPANANGELAGMPEELPDGDEIITRRYEFYKYTGPIDAESGEAMASEVGPDGIHGVGSVTYNDHFDPVTGEWVEVTLDLTTVEVVGEFFGAQMSAFDVAPVLGLIDHIPDGELGVPYADRTVVVASGAAFLASVSGNLPDGTSFDELTGIFSGTPMAAGVFIFTVDASDFSGAFVTKTYTVTIPEALAVISAIFTSASPPAGGTTAGDGVYENGTPVIVVATHNADYAFVNWTEGGVEASASANYPFTVNSDRTLVAHFILVGCVVDADCADEDACTADTCVANVCDHQPIALCCNINEQCEDGDACTRDVCINHVCTFDMIPACCTIDAQCTDADDCTSDACVNFECQHTGVPGCCRTDADCDDTDVCTTDRCEDHLCRHVDIPGCCTSNAECDDDIECTMDWCVGRVCRHLPKNWVCNDGKPCNGREFCDPTVGCVQGTPVDCDDGIECTVDTCSEVLRKCLHTPDDLLCDDGVFCNGEERCNTHSGCHSGRKPCPPPFCDETTDVCIERPGHERSNEQAPKERPWP